MFRTPGDRQSSWEPLPPPEVFFAPYFHSVIGQPSTPVECYLRLEFLKFRYTGSSGTAPTRASSSGIGWVMRACPPRRAGDHER